MQQLQAAYATEITTENWSIQVHTQTLDDTTYWA